MRRALAVILSAVIMVTGLSVTVSPAAAETSSPPSAPLLQRSGTTVTWAEPASQAPITGYRYQLDCGFFSDAGMLGSSERSISISSSSPCIIRVAALTADVVGTTARLVTTLGSSLPLPRISVIERTASTVTLAVQAVRSAIAPVDSWAVDVFDATAAADPDYFAPGAGTTVEISAPSDDEAVITIGNLDSARTYSLGVFARSSSAGLASPWAFISSVTTLNSAPAATGVIELSSSGSSVVLDARGLGRVS